VTSADQTVHIGKHARSRKSGPGISNQTAPGPFLYPKKTSKTDSNLNRDLIREVTSGAGWRAVSIEAIDEVWSALRFRLAGQVGSRSKRSPA
jgi:hypothetical protein